MDDPNYDEFGNYIGPDIESEEEDDRMDVEEQEAPAWMRPNVPDTIGDGAMQLALPSDILNTQVVLHEDKKYYPEASEVYGEDVDIVIHEEDTQPLSEPIVASTKVRQFTVVERDVPETSYEKQYLVDLMANPGLSRLVAVVGHLHHGKTSLVDLLLSHTHNLDFEHSRIERFTDNHPLERTRQLSIKSAPVSIVLPDLKGKSYAINLIDTPGHVNFSDEAAAGLRLADGALLVVDVVEGVMVQTDRLIKHLVTQRIPITVVLTKMDRLMLELKLPPVDAYFKLKHTLDEINALISTYGGDASQRVSPELGNVCFASAHLGFVISLKTVSQVYSEEFGGAIDAAELSKRLWGDVYYHKKTRAFKKTAPDSDTPRTFVQFVLDPLYKLVSQVVGEDAATLQKTLEKLRITLKPKQYTLNIKPLLKLVLSAFYGTPGGLTTMFVDHIPSPQAAAAALTQQLYSGPADSLAAQSMSACSADGPLVFHVTKLYPSEDGRTFDAFGRVLSGTLTAGQRVRVLGEGYHPDDQEDMSEQTVESLWVHETRYRFQVNQASAGMWVLAVGIDASIVKTATVVAAAPAKRGKSAQEEEELYIIRPLKFMTSPVIKIAIEPLNPSELPKMLDGLRKVNKTYPLVQTKVEESGEHTVFGTGELYLDCVMHDLRKVFAEIEIKVSDPVVTFCETVVDTSAFKCFAETPNKKNKLTMIAEPLEKDVATDIESRNLLLSWPKKRISEHLQTRHNWDILAARSLWAFGPDDHSPNVLLDDTLPTDVDKERLYTVKESIKQGFQWGAREGPLCDEPLRNVKFRLVDAYLAEEALQRSAGQIIPTARRVCYSSFLMATPRLMEPIYSLEIQAPADCLSAVYTVLANRRGHVLQDGPKAGSPLYVIKGLIPVIDSFGFETDLRTHTQGQAFCQQVFDHWQITPGDPLDKTISLRPLEPAPAQHLARDFMIKTRRRKGLSEDVSVNKFFDDPMLLEMAKQDLGIMFD